MIYYYSVWYSHWKRAAPFVFRRFRFSFDMLLPYHDPVWYSYHQRYDGFGCGITIPNGTTSGMTALNVLFLEHLHMSRGKTKPTKWPVRPVWSVFSVRMEISSILHYPMSAQRRMIRLGATSYCWFCCAVAHIKFGFKLTDPMRRNSEHQLCWIKKLHC